MSVDTVGGKISDKNLQWRVKFTVSAETGKSASEMLSLKTHAYDECDVKRTCVLNGIGSPAKGAYVCKITQELGSQRRKEQMLMWTEYKPWDPEM